MKTPFRASSLRRGFTLTEVLIASTAATIVMAGVCLLVVGVARVNFDSVAKLTINRDVRSFTHQLVEAGRSARKFEIYPSMTNLLKLGPGQSGDVLLFAMADTVPINDPAIGVIDSAYLRRVTVFARDASTTVTGPVRRYDLDFPPASAPGAVLMNTTTLATIASGMMRTQNRTPGVRVREVVELTRGLSNERLFLYFSNGESVIVNGEIYHNNRAREVTNTYNFTITPRG